MLAVPALAWKIPTADEAHEKSTEALETRAAAEYSDAMLMVKLAIDTAVEDGYFQTSVTVEKPKYRKPIAERLRKLGYTVTIIDAKLRISWWHG